MHELKEMLCQRLKEYERKGSLSASDLEQVHMLTDTIKNIGKIKMQGEYSQGWSDYSQGNNGSYGSYGNSYGDGSYARRGTHYVRGHYSRGMADEIEEKLHDPHLSSQDKESLRRAIELLR